MPDLTYYMGRWVALGEDGDVAAVGETLEETRRFGVQARPRSRLTFARVSLYPPHVLLPEWPLTTIRDIQHETPTWLAGGPVRDLLLARTPHDWDFVTAGSGLALARATADALAGAYYPLDSDRGTGRALATPPGSTEPITLDFAELRGPDLDGDLWKRDFTINAMALTLDGKLIDPTGGQDDLQARTLRMTTPAAFEDDPARLLRAVRLATQFAFTIERETANSLRSQAATIRTVAPERIRQELVRLLGDPRAHHGLTQLHHFGLLSHVLPEIAAVHATATGGEYTGGLTDTVALITTLQDMDKVLHGEPAPRLSRLSTSRHAGVPSWAWETLSAACAQQQRALLAYLAEPMSADTNRSTLLKCAALFCPPDVDRVAPVASQHAEIQYQALRFSGRSIDFAVALVRHLPGFGALAMRAPRPDGMHISDRDIYRYFRSAGDAGVAVALLGLARLLVNQGGNLKRESWTRHLTTATALFEAYFERRDLVIVPPPLLTGWDLMQLGLPQGPAIGRALESLLEAQAAGEVTDRTEAAAHIEHFIKTQNTAEDAHHATHDAR